MTIKEKLNNQVDILLDIKHYFEITGFSTIPTYTDFVNESEFEGKRFEAVCLSIDIRGSSSLVEKYDAKVVALVHKAFFHIVVSIISKNNGFIRSFNGDGLLCFFKRNNADSINDAVKSAMMIKYLLSDDENSFKVKVKKSYNVSIDFGIGIDFGTVVATKIGNLNNTDLLWIGSCVNKSVKLSKSGKVPNNIKITKRLYDNLTNVTKYRDEAKKEVNMWQKSQAQYNNKNIDIYVTKYIWKE